MSIPLEAIQEQIADVLTFVVQMERKAEKRIAAEVIRLAGFDPKTRSFEYEQVGE